jgi:vacuolar-type H+-ATPase subunit E/Vma4
MKARLLDALAPVHAAVLQAARDDANHTAAQAKAAADDTLGAAQSQADQVRAQARAQGAADAQVYLAAERIRARREARTIVLQAQREAYEDLHRAAREAVAGLRTDPDFPLLRQRLVDAVRRRLGDEATIHDDAGGGVVGEVAGRRLDYSLARLADQAVDTVAAGLEAA